MRRSGRVVRGGVRAEVEAAGRGVLEPELGADVVGLGMVGDVISDGGNVVVEIALTIASCPMRDQIEVDVVRKVAALAGVESVSVEVGVMNDEQRTKLMERA